MGALEKDAAVGLNAVRISVCTDDSPVADPFIKEQIQLNLKRFSKVSF